MEERVTGAEIRLTAEEIDLLRTALRYLEDTLSREEADELQAVQALLARLERLGST